LSRESAIRPLAGSGPDRLRASYIWQNEVMADAVFPPGSTVTVGPTKDCTFATPELGLPDDFAILRPGARGYVLTLREGMTGKLSLAGDEHAIERFIARAKEGTAAAGDFRATPVAPGDWGVIELDGTGEHNFFFQFVPSERPLPPARRRWDEILVPALAFAIVFHAILVTITYLLHDKDNNMIFPGSRDLMTAYLVKRPPPPDPKPTGDDKQAGAKDEEGEQDKPAATIGKKGKAGGKRRRRPRAPTEELGFTNESMRKVYDSGLLRERKAITDLTKQGGFDKDFGRALSRLKDDQRLASGDGDEDSGGGVGDGDGPGTTRGSDGDGSGGGGSSHHAIESSGSIDTGGERTGHGTGGRGAREVKLTTENPTGDFGSLTPGEIDSVVKSRRGLYRSCYQKQLNRMRELSGKLVVRFRIDADGKVKSAKVVRSKSTLRNAAVEDCVTRHIMRLQFPAKGGALVNYPFFFSQG